MNMRLLITKELWARPTAMLTCLVIIALGVSAVVATQHLLTYSELAVARELDALGANVLILPKDVTVQDYYAADVHDKTLPEEYVTRLTLSNLQGVDNLSPKLCLPIVLQGSKVTLTGILPKSEFQAKAAWQGVGIFARPLGCGAEAAIPDKKEDPKALARKRVIETLNPDEVLVGVDVAERLLLQEGDKLTVLGKEFQVIAVLPPTGTVDDARLFAHLHTVQGISGKGPVVSVIEVVGCCKVIAKGLVDNIRDVLPDAKVVTIAQVVQTQQTVNTMMHHLSLGFLVILVVVGGISLASAMCANVGERRREIGTLMALGGTPWYVLRLFLGKATVLGLVGGILGTALGTVVAIYLGPELANAVVRPIPWLMGGAVGVALVLSLVATCWPAFHAARLDPSLSLREV